MMSERVSRGKNLLVAKVLDDLLVNEILPGIHNNASSSSKTKHVDSVDEFWLSFEKVVTTLAPKNKHLLQIRNDLQTKIDTYWNTHNNNDNTGFEQQEAYLREIGYLVEDKDDDIPFEIATENVDDEIAKLAGPQLVVPVTNARFAINAVNARWGSLYNALYGTDVISDTNGAEKQNGSSGYNPVRGEKVIEFAKNFLNQAVPFKDNHKYQEVVNFSIVPNTHTQNGGTNGNSSNTNSSMMLVAELKDGTKTQLRDPTQFIGYTQDNNTQITTILLKNNGLHIELQIDRIHSHIGQQDPAGIKDIVLESAITTIQDFEDSVAVVDADDKVGAYRNWLQIMQGTISSTFTKSGTTMTRTMNPDREYTSALNNNNNNKVTLSGRSLLLVRNVGHFMTTDAVLIKNNNTGDYEEIPEGILDAMFTSLIAIYDLYNQKNSKTGSIYIVKPKMHGPDEVAFTNELLNAVEDALKLPRHTIKVGIMDEERRTTINLKQCVKQVRERIIFINTGFLDRTGDEIHTNMECRQPMIRKGDMKSSSKWLPAYETYNVHVGLSTGFTKCGGQIGKGMWAIPDQMNQMYQSKHQQLLSGANCAWVPSPTAATIHAMHYHTINVTQVQQDKLTEIMTNADDSKTKQQLLQDILTLPVLPSQTYSEEEIQQELNNNIQGMLGYVVRWIHHGVGCSKVPDINGIGLMEDRATLRISSQHVCNWIHHDLCTREQVLKTLQTMAKIVDEQNNDGDKNNYIALLLNPNNNETPTTIAYQAACDLIFQGKEQPNGYTEPILHAARKQFKMQQQQQQQQQT